MNNILYLYKQNPQQYDWTLDTVRCDQRQCPLGGTVR